MPTPIRWQVPTTLSAAEQHVADKLHRIGKFYVFLREIRAQLFDEAFEAELILYNPGTATGIWRIPAAGGEAVPVTQPGPKDNEQRFPEVLPNGNGLLFSAARRRYRRSGLRGVPSDA